MALHVRLTDDLKKRLEGGEWQAGEKLPTEEALALDYAVSRATVRLALKLLESQGVVQTRRGAGTFVTALGVQGRWGLQELRSTTETLRAQGFEPMIRCRRAELRRGSPEFASRLSLPTSTEVVYLEREILADGKLVSYSYDEVRADLVAFPVEAGRFSESIFELLEETAGVRHAYASTEINAVHDAVIGWGDQRPANPLYLQLRQAHFTYEGTPTLYSRNYFVEGRLQFTLLRVSDGIASK